MGKLYISVPYETASGTYTIDVKVSNDDTESSASKQITVKNNFDKVVIPTANGLLIVNPTDSVVVYRIVPEAAEGVSVTVSESTIAIPAGSSKSVSVSATTEEDATYSVSVFKADGTMVDTVTFSATAAESSVRTSIASPVVVLTIILAIIFIVLLVVLIVLIGKKPEKSEEFGESYY